MTIRRVLRLLAQAAFATLALSLVSCPNPLLTTIEETVEIAVTPPEIDVFYPTADATDIPINLQTITITFSKTIDRNTVNTGTVKITAPDGNRFIRSVGRNHYIQTERDARIRHRVYNYRDRGHPGFRR